MSCKRDKDGGLTAMRSKISVMEGSMAVAEAVRACKPDVISAYPISPQTHIVEYISEFAASGRFGGQFVRVDSEFSAASVVHGASAAGARAYTASSSQGLLLMTEVIFNMASTRLPVVFTGVNRTVSAPISIQPDHQDTMTLRDTGLIQIHVESLQEAYDAHIQAFKVAEDKEVLLPVMVCMDGWILTHAFEPVKVFSDQDVFDFVGKYEPVQWLDPKNPISYGAFADEDKLMEYKYIMIQAQQKAKEKIERVARDYQERFGHYDGGLVDEYRTDDADIVLVAMGSVVSTIRAAVDELREAGKKVGALKIRSYRPFPREAIIKACHKAKALAVLDKSISIDTGGILVSDVKTAFYDEYKKPLIISYIAGLGGKEVNRQVIKDIVANAEGVLDNGKVEGGAVFVNLNTQFV
jgi:pyruvate ferredoxin oxidoreductase alpha subunit